MWGFRNLLTASSAWLFCVLMHRTTSTQWPLCVSCCLQCFCWEDRLHNCWRPTAQWGGNKLYHPALAVISSGNQTQTLLLFLILPAEDRGLSSTHQHQPGMCSLDRESVLPHSAMTSLKLQTEVEALSSSRGYLISRENNRTSAVLLSCILQSKVLLD